MACYSPILRSFRRDAMAEWVRHNVGKVFVMNSEWALDAWIGNPSPVCLRAEQCGRTVVLEHNAVKRPVVRKTSDDGAGLN